MSPIVELASPPVSPVPLSSEKLAALQAFAGHETGPLLWHETARCLLKGVLPLLLWRHDTQQVLLNYQQLLNALALPHIVGPARDQAIPMDHRVRLKAYLATLPYYSDAYFRDDGSLTPLGNSPENAGHLKSILQAHAYAQGILASLLDTLFADGDAQCM